MDGAVTGVRKLIRTGKNIMYRGKTSEQKFPGYEVIAKRFKENPKSVCWFAKRLLSEIERRSATEKFPEEYWEWYAILTLWPVPRIIRLLEESDDEDDRLRQSFPLFDLLTPHERLSLLSAPSNQGQRSIFTSG
jgi:hypothetical protein